MCECRDFGTPKDYHPHNPWLFPKILSSHIQIETITPIWGICSNPYNNTTSIFNIFFFIFVINFNKNLINEIKIIISDIVKLNPKKTKEKTLSRTQYGNSTLAYISHNLATSSSISFNCFFMSSIWRKLMVLAGLGVAY